MSRHVWALLPLVFSLSASAAGNHQIVEVEGGVPLMHVSAAPGSTMSSFRFIVRAGGFQDPPGKEGLAHLLEHLIFHGNYDLAEGDIWRAVRSRGGEINAFTSTSTTVYALDAPHEAFLPLMEQFTSLITNPALRLAHMERERDVIAVEQRERSIASLLEVLDMHLFQDRVGEVLIGNRTTRGKITMDDIIAFYQQHYTAGNVAVVVVSRASADEARVALNRSFLLPPEPPRVEPEEVAEPLLPLDQKSRSWVTATVFGYRIPDGEDATCHDIATLLEHRVYKRLVMDDPVASDTKVVCRRARGRTFLLALAFTANLLGSNIPVEMEDIFQEAIRKQPSTAELKLIQARVASLQARMRRQSSELATGLAFATSESPEGFTEVVSRALRAPAMKWDKMHSVMKASFKPNLRVVLHYSPFEG